MGVPPQLGEKGKQQRLPSYSMTTNMLPLIGQPKSLLNAMLATTLACLDHAASESFFDARSDVSVDSSQSLACCRRLEPSLGKKNHQMKRLPFYSMNTNMLLLTGQPRSYKTCMSRMYCFEVASSARRATNVALSQSLACCRRLDVLLYSLLGAPPAVFSNSFTCSADARLTCDFFSAHKTQSMAVYSWLLLIKLGSTPLPSQNSTQDEHPSDAAASKEYPLKPS